MKEVGTVHRDLQARGSHLVEQATTLLGRDHHVVCLWLERQRDPVLLGDPYRLLHGNKQVSPGPGAVVLGMVAPHVLGIARAGAQRDHRRTQPSAGFSEYSEPPQPLTTLPAV